MVETRLPKAFVARLRDIVPSDQFDSVLQSFAAPTPTYFRVNKLKSTIDAVLGEIDRLGITCTPVAYREDCFRVENTDRDRLTHSDLANDGSIYIQDLASVVIASLLAAQAEEEILDLAAAPGGKTLVLASAMDNRGRIAAVEAVKKRFFQLKTTVNVYGASCVDCYLKDGRRVGRQVPGRFDRVLLDAPCSSESRFDPNRPSSYEFWSEKKIADMQRKQKQLLHSAITALKPGGRLVYSTCSFAPEENECVVDRQLQVWGDQLQIVPIDLPIDNVQSGLTQWQNKTLAPSMVNARRILPNAEMKGFFACVLQKSPSEKPNR